MVAEGADRGPRIVEVSSWYDGLQAGICEWDGERRYFELHPDWSWAEDDDSPRQYVVLTEEGGEIVGGFSELDYTLEGGWTHLPGGPVALVNGEWVRTGGTFTSEV